ncbi:MAG TPA: ATP synthase F1 subunit delta [Thermoanaerobaculia bacterium]|nr:ATP synthase F1 subunit delta [Thermoanaerobaculia bacterium]
MGPTIIARNYAETLLALAHRQGGGKTVDAYAAAIDQVADLVESEPLIREFLETPRIDIEAKKQALQKSLGGRVPEIFLRFITVVLEKRRQGVLRQIAEQYHLLVDEERGRVRANVSLAREADQRLRGEIVASLERRLGREVLPSFTVDPRLGGGIVIEVAGEILDGSLRRRVAGLRRRLLNVRIPVAVAGGDR